jgi:hypothetical protein
MCINYKKLSDSEGREVLYNVRIGFGTPIKLVRIIKMILNETSTKSI